MASLAARTVRSSTAAHKRANPAPADTPASGYRGELNAHDEAVRKSTSSSKTGRELATRDRKYTQAEIRKAAKILASMTMKAEPLPEPEAPSSEAIQAAACRIARAQDILRSLHSIAGATDFHLDAVATFNEYLMPQVSRLLSLALRDIGQSTYISWEPDADFAEAVEVEA